MDDYRFVIINKVLFLLHNNHLSFKKDQLCVTPNVALTTIE